jgi:hypothetical protein
MIFNCSVCDKEFERRKSSGAKFCSIECRDNQRIKHLTYDELKEIIKPFNFKSIAAYKVFAKENGWPLSPSSYFEKRGFSFNTEDFLSKELYKFKNLNELKRGIADYNKNNPDDIIDNDKKYRTWSTKNGAPTSPKSSYKLIDFDLKDLLGTKLMNCEEFIKFCNENNIKSNADFCSRKEYKLNDNPFAWQKSVPRSKFPDGFEWSMLENFSGKVEGQQVEVEVAIEFYRKELANQKVSNYGQLNRENWHYTIPKHPMSVYPNFTWSLVTGKSNGIIEAKANRIEIARLIVSQAEIIDILDDTLVAILLSKLYDKVKLTDLVKCEIKKIVNKAISDNKQGDRKEALLEAALKIEEASNFDEMVDNSTDMVNEAEPDSDNIESIDRDPEDVVDDLENDSSETIMTVDYENRLKNIVKVVNKNILNEDLDVDVKELMLKNATKALWYLECSK